MTWKMAQCFSLHLNRSVRVIQVSFNLQYQMLQESCYLKDGRLRHVRRQYIK